MPQAAEEYEEPSAPPEAVSKPQPPYRVQDPLVELMALPGGTFWMGSDKALDRYAYDDEQPRREISVSPFAIARTPVTRGLYRSVMKKSPQNWEGDKDDADLPASYLS